MVDAEALGPAREVTTTLDALGVDYIIGGSLASIVYGMVRSTLDADIIAALEPRHAAALITALSDQFYVPEESYLREAIERQGSFNLIHLATMFKIDMFVLRERLYDRQQLARRIGAPVRGTPMGTVWVLSPEDVILSKLEWFRIGGEVSERQWRDVLGVIQTQAMSLNITYLREWAPTLEVSDLLEQALTQAPMDES